MIIQANEFILSPVVSVIVVTYNQEITISQTIDSILNQKHDLNLEIIIGEDFGKDKTREICIEYQRKYPQLIKLVLSDKNQGVVNNWLKCIKEARGKYLAFCAGDDYWHNPLKMKLQYDFMEKNPNCGVLHTDYDEINTITNKIKQSVFKATNKIVLDGFVQKEIFNGKLKISAPTVCIRKELFDKYIPVNKYIELDFPIEDWPTWIILSKYSKVNYLPVSTVTYRKGHESLSNLKGYDKVVAKYRREKIMYRYVCNLFPEDLPFDEKGYDNYVNGILLSLAFKKWDYTSANNYAKVLLNNGVSNLKVWSALNPISFVGLGMLKKIKSKFTHKEF